MQFTTLAVFAVAATAAVALEPRFLEPRFADTTNTHTETTTNTVDKSQANSGQINGPNLHCRHFGRDFNIGGNANNSNNGVKCRREEWLEEEMERREIEQGEAILRRFLDSTNTNTETNTNTHDNSQANSGVINGPNFHCRRDFNIGGNANNSNNGVKCRRSREIAARDVAVVSRRYLTGSSRKRSIDATEQLILEHARDLGFEI